MLFAIEEHNIQYDVCPWNVRTSIKVIQYICHEQHTIHVYPT